MNNIQKNPTEHLFLRDALYNLQAGYLDAADKEVLSYTPLPDTVIDPYLSQQVESKTAMDLTYNSLVTWIEEAKKTNYFSKHFVTLSKLINNGVATMARGLVTLHMNGEDISLAPMSIDELIGISSYQFRKSYLGVLQTSAKNPEIGERLLLNQLSWTTTLLRLYKTKDKLAEKPVIKNHKPDIKAVENQDDINSKQAEISEALTITEPLLSIGNESALSEPQALSEPGAFSAVRSYSEFSEKDVRKSGSSKKQLQKDTNSCPEISLPHKHPKDNTEQKTAMFNETEKLPDGNKEAAKSLSEKENSPAAEAKHDTVSGNKNSEEIDIAQRIGSETSNEKPKADPEEKEKSASAPNSDEEKQKIRAANLFENKDDAAEDILHSPPEEIPIPDADHPPKYFRILYDALCRSGAPDNGEIIFTNDEIAQLLADPEFCFYEKETADVLRKLFDREQITE